MARRKTAEVEILPPENEQPKPRGRKKLVEAEHTIKYSAPVPVEVEEDPEEIIIGDDDLIFDDRPRRKPPQNEREQLRKRLSSNGVTPSSQLKLSIERYTHTDSMDSGTQADKVYCTKYACNEAHVTGEDYLDVARQYGSGRYWFTLRLNNKIVTQWERRIDVSPQMNPAGMNGATMNGVEYAPPMAYQANGPQQTPLTFQDYLKQMVQTKKLMDEISGTVPIPPQQSEEVALASLLLKDPANAKRMARNLLGGEGEKDMVALAIENGPAIIEAFGNMVLKIIGDVRSTNGHAQIPPQAFSMGTQESQQNNRMQTFPQVDQGGQSSGAHSMGQPDTSTATAMASTAIAPDEQILTHLFNYVIEQCRTQTAPELVAAGVDRFMDEQVGNDFPLYFDKVWAQLENFAGMDADIVLAYVKTLPGGATVADMPHAKDWLIKLQELLKPEAEASA